MAIIPQPLAQIMASLLNLDSTDLAILADISRQCRNHSTVAENMICLCNTCNMSKGAKDAEQWLIQKFGKKEAKKILERIEAYFKSLG